MARQYSKGHGHSGSSLPWVRRPAEWSNQKSEEVIRNVCTLARKGLQPSLIGQAMRDSYGVGLVNHYTGTRITKILAANDLAPKVPEDLFYLIKRAVNIRKHLEHNPRDICSKYHLILVESRIYRQIRYLKRNQKIDQSLKYKGAEAASLLAQWQ